MRHLLPLLALCACASSPRPWSGRTLCEGTTNPEKASIDAGAWFALLLRGYDPRTGTIPTPAVDCTGAEVQWDAPGLLCLDGAFAKRLLPARRLEARDVAVAPYGDDVQLVWVMTGRYVSGEAVGPVAVVERRRGDLLVRAAGLMRTYPERVSLRLEKIGATTVLVGEGEVCPRRDRSSCQRGARLVPLRGDRFRPEALFSERGDCLSAAWIDLGREESERLDTGIRRYQFSASLSFEQSLLRIDEQILVNEIDPRNTAAPPRLVRRDHADRVVTMSGDKMVAHAPSLWMKVINASE
jgi:hypothetical protein